MTTRSKRRHATPPPPGCIVLDSGGLSALAADRALRRAIDALLALGWTPLVPAPVLAEALEGHAGRDARANQVLNALGERAQTPCTSAVARTAAALRTRALRAGATPSGIDAIVAACAVASRPTALIVTTDPCDLEALVSHHPHVQTLDI